MAINVNLGVRHDVDPATQPIARDFVGYDREVSDDQLWNANRGAWQLPEGSDAQQFVTLSHDGTIRLVAELEGVENVRDGDRTVQALLGRVLRIGDPVRDRLVGSTVPDTRSEVTFIDTAEFDEMSAADRYAPRAREPRTFLITFDPEQWFWTPEDEQSIVDRTATGATVRETWSAGGRRQGMEPGDRVYLLQAGSGSVGVRGRGVVSSRIYQGEHFDDPSRVANYIDIEWDRVLSPERLIDRGTLRAEVPGYAWNPQKGGVQLHEPMAGHMEDLWTRHLGAEHQPVVQQEAGWEIHDQHRRQVRAEARHRIQAAFQADGWEVNETEHRPYCAVASHDGEVKYLFGRAAETAGRPVVFSSEERDFVLANGGHCVMGVVSDAVFHGGSIEPGSGEFRMIDLPSDADSFEPVLYYFRPDQG